MATGCDSEDGSLAGNWAGSLADAAKGAALVAALLACGAEARVTTWWCVQLPDGRSDGGAAVDSWPDRWEVLEREGQWEALAQALPHA